MVPQASRMTFLSSFLGCWLSFVLLSVNIIQHCFNNIEAQTLETKTINDCLGFSIQVYFYCLGSVFGLSVMMEN